MKPVLAIIVSLVLLAGVATAESNWQGNSAMSRFGEFPERGNYGASNSFPKNTLIEVTNLDTGAKAKLIVVDRLDDPGLFLLLSREAAADLGISEGDVVRVQASIARPEGVVRTFGADLPYNPDPDTNPAASVQSFEQLIADARAEVAARAAASKAATAETETGETETAETETAETETAETETVEKGPRTDEIAAAVAETATTDLVPEDPPVPDTDTGADSEGTATGPTLTGTAEADPPDNGENGSIAHAGDEPNLPIEPADEVALTALESVDNGSASEQPLTMRRPPEPPVAGIFPVRVTKILPAPELDTVEEFVLLTTPDEPALPTALAGGKIETVEVDRVSLSSLVEPVVEDIVEEPLAVFPPEPVFAETEIAATSPEDPVAEDILQVSGLLPPSDGFVETLALAGDPDEPPLPDGGEAPAASAGPFVSGLILARAETVEESLVLARVPDEPVAPSDAALRPETGVVAAETPDLARLELIASAAGEEPREIDPDVRPAEPVFEEMLEEPFAEDLLRVSALRARPTPADAASLAYEGIPAPEVEKEELPRVVNGFAPPTALSDEVELVLEPAEPRPPTPRIAPEDAVTTPAIAEADRVPETHTEPTVSEPVTVATEPASAEGTAEVDTTVTTARVGEPLIDVKNALEPEAYYLQLGVFGEAGNARQLSEQLAATYPVTVYSPAEAVKPQYKVMVGPLNQDESGAILRVFRARGFPDAFVRRGS